jgi:hypothetical protein
METNVPTLPTEKAIESKPAIAKFQMSIKDAGHRYHGWVDKQKFVHNDIDIEANKGKIIGTWVPVWLFEVSAESAWHGEVSHTETRSRTRYNYVEKRDEHYEEDEEVWEPVSSTHHGSYLIPVSASRVITQKEIEGLNFKQIDLNKYDESYLDGWQVQATDLNKMEAEGICNSIVGALEKLACMRQVERLNGCSTKVKYTASNFALLPVFVLSYSCNNEFYRNLINGLTGEVIGNFPVNKGKKILFTVLKVAAVVVGVIVLLGILGSR